jgi:hypothetical protein
VSDITDAIVDWPRAFFRGLPSREQMTTLRSALLLLPLLALGSGCFLQRAVNKLHERTVDRPPGLDCTRFTFVYTSAHLGDERWTEPELDHIERTEEGGKLYGTYVACPEAAPGDASLVRAWQAWREVRLADPKRYWTYAENPAPAQLEPMTLAPAGPARTRVHEGTLVRIQSMHAFFRGCDYWPVTDPSYKCEAS